MTSDQRPLAAVRRLILGVLLLGMTGLLTELLLLAHYEDRAQWIPLGVVAAGLVSLGIDTVHPRRWTLGLVRIVMVLLMVTGPLGMYLHYRGSREFQLEVDPTRTGMTLVWSVLRAKSPPTLSPGTLVPMGLLGLGYAYARKRD